MSTTEELWQSYNEQGERVKKSLTRAQCKKGELHGSSHVWVWRRTNSGIEVLLQRRASSKLTWPGHDDISAAGHINFGETPIKAAIRETQEEIGLPVKASELYFLSARRDYIVDESSDFIENEIRWLYAYELKQAVDLVFNDGEVEKIAWVPLADLKKASLGAGPTKLQLVPQGKAYFTTLIQALTKFQNENYEH